MTTAVDYGPRDRSLERALLFSCAIHAVALLAMTTLLIGTLPGGTVASDAARIYAIAQHPARLRIGWLPWQLCAFADVWLAIAMVRTPWLPRLPALVVLVLTVAAFVPDQYAQAMWITRGVALAQTDGRAYLALERTLLPLTAGWGAIGYTLAAMGWTWCFARAGVWSRTLSILSVTAWSTLLVAAIAQLLPTGVRPSARLVSMVTGVGFAQLQLWLLLVAEAVLRRARPFEPHGRRARWRHPGPRPLRWIANALANSRVLRALFEPLPCIAMRSDITDVVYVNYLIPAADAARLVPPPLVLQRLGPDGAWALFTFLTYRHGHFGFASAGPLRKIMPSPVQSNWRVHVVDPHTGYRGVYFVTNAIGNTVQALAARVAAEGMPMHVLERSAIVRHGVGAATELTVTLVPGDGSAPDAELVLHATASPPAWTGPWAACFADWSAFLAYCVPQDRALSPQPLRRRIARQEIELGIPLDACLPLAGTVSSRAATAIAGDAAPMCFFVSSVTFTFSGEAHDQDPTDAPRPRS